MALDETDGSLLPSGGDTEAPQGIGHAQPQAEAPTPTGYAQPPVAEHGQGPEPAAPTALESLEQRLSTVEKRYEGAQAKITAQAEELKAYRQALAAPRTPQYQAPPVQQLQGPPMGYQEPYAGADQFQYQQPQYAGAPAMEGLQQRTVQDLVLEGLAGRVHELTLEQRMTAAEEAVGFRFNADDKEALVSYMRTVRPGDTDLASGAQSLFWDRALKAREKAGREAALREVQKAQTAAAPAPAGRPGEPQREFSGGGSFGEYTGLIEDALKRPNL